MTMDATAPAPRRIPLTLLIPGVGVLGGLAGGFVVGVLVVVWSAVESGGQDVPLIAIMIGLIAGTVLGAAMGVVASLLRILIGVHFGPTGELVAVAAGALLTPLVYVAVGGASEWILLVATIIGGLAAWQFCRTVLKRARQQAPEIGNY
jgi:hypothetical protein